ncbi:arginine/ornithine succinyltransferase subunit alpha [Burkholderia glumae]|uniref:Arginine/ornithine succinyltransferase subunit alpha n=2 Tax=Burkholderia glumae TaxID=337 RepID=A0AAP9Y540_BURGL|nr:arginine/ornithine succinyltransferase subunit alpha [Burkholderia glumae]ACR28185.1 Arginine N-succinyltransferase subunit alpha [Burkholderia glumae BGR1]AJY65241.1 arginine/ornithine succinyltransferase, alpha subunit [Burkholderia glumae LMG 2196 = ATCC 33617]MCM2480829.1 arginine/ornithine succinyltransferase subunit alpha [Burkholderia glumae]MCM2492484.1 arginine/ornithine succinyltransferase subunit alpha [Burkholderia glumae]MCM2509032.1 arginine/ornithine succinyltransferase subun
MLFVRPGRLADLDALAQMARTARPVLHSLPHDRRALEARVALSEDSFRADADFPGEEFYLFVLEDSETGRLLGTASIVAAAGYSEPFYAFRNDALIHASRELHVNRRIHALTMSHELTGKSRLAGFYVDPALRGDAAAHLVSRARMMYIAANRRRFTPEVFSLLLGVTDEHGASPFWEAVGRKFFRRDFADIEVESGGRSRTFIAEVMPVYPVYVPLLPEAAQRVLGEPNRNGLLAYDIHLEEGFEPDRYVDIFDAGPVLTAQIDRTACVTHGSSRTVRAADAAHGTHGGGATHLVSAGAGDAFRCVLADLPDAAGLNRGELAPLDAAARAALGVVDGDTVYCVPLHRREEADAPAQALSGASR